MSSLLQKSPEAREAKTQPVPSGSNANANATDTPAPPSEQPAPTLAALKAEIVNLLPPEWASRFTTSYNCITLFSGRKRNALEPYLRQLEALVSCNPQIADLYDALCARHAETRVRAQNRLPEFSELERRKYSATMILEWKDYPRVEETRAKYRDEVRRAQGTPVRDEGDDLVVRDMFAIGEAEDANVFRDGTRAFDLPSRVEEPTDDPALDRTTNHEGTIAEASSKTAVTSASSDEHNDESGHTTPWFLKRINVQNPESFPIKRIQNLERDYPWARVTAMHQWRDMFDGSIMAVVEMTGGPYNEIQIHNMRHIAALGLNIEPNDRIEIHPEHFQVDETFTLHLCDSRDSGNLDKEISGFIPDFLSCVLCSGRHAFLHWLDTRIVMDPRGPPFASEAKVLAMKLKRPPLEVWEEIRGYWELEQGKDGRRYRWNRKRYLGEDPKYPDGKEREPPYGMWL